MAAYNGGATAGRHARLEIFCGVDMQYWLLKRSIPDEDRARVVDDLIALRAQLDRTVPCKDSDNNLLMASWNIRDLGKSNRRGFGVRMPESHFYIAEVISRFDFVAVQEVNTLAEWGRIMDILGPHWDYIATDVADPSIGGNGERLTYAFDRRKVAFRNIAGEIVLPENLMIGRATGATADGGRVTGGRQFSRTPFIAAFQSAWFRFDICTVHIYYGADYGEKLQRRIEEIDGIASYLSTRADEAFNDSNAMVLLGDFNIVSPEHGTMKALEAHDFKVPEPLQSKPTNAAGNKHYDQIAFKTLDEGIMRYVETTSDDPLQCNAGVVDLFENLYADARFDAYRNALLATDNGAGVTGDAALRKYYLDWRTYQFSDHMPMWVRLNTNSSGPYLNKLRAGPDR